jgi:glycosyltransferase involved in cell wall biosynthesis
MCSDHEGTPMTALEALALGKPLIAHNVGGLREILSESPDLLIDEHNSVSYSAKIIELVKNARPTALNEIYTSACNASRTLSLYKTITTIR